MGIKKGKYYKIPAPSSIWTFNQSASPIVDKGGFANLTSSGTVTYNGNSITTTGSSGVFNATAGIYGKIACFSCFVIFRPVDTSGDSDILSLGSGTGFTADDYTWYLDTSSGSNGWKFGVAPGSGDYGNQLEVLSGTIDNTKKHYIHFGFMDTPSTNSAFINVKVEGGALIYHNESVGMSAYPIGRSHSLANTAYFAGGTIGAEYFKMMYWENRYLNSQRLFQELLKRHYI